ncbi:MAG TPA: hypothetical protein VJR58_16175 [Vineibacter sp.]|nr:hypothetical protein [Vineibacter sp.]
MRRSIASVAVAAALILVGCDEYAWERPGTPGVVQRSDYNDCRQQVRSEAFRSYAFHSGFPIMGPAYWGFRQQPDYGTWRTQLEREPLFYDNRLAHFCMRTKGYILVKLEDGYRDLPSRPTDPPPSSNVKPR